MLVWVSLLSSLIFCRLGVSSRTQEVYLIVFVARYLDLFWLYVSLYNTGIISSAHSAKLMCSNEGLFHSVYGLVDIQHAVQAASEHDLRQERG